MRTCKFHLLDAATAKGVVLGLVLCFITPVICPAAGPPPIIDVQPLDQTVQEGDTVVLVVVARSSTAMTYQWYFDGKKIPAANSSVLGIENVTLADAGIYYVTVRNSSGTVTSSNAVLTVLSVPINFTSATMTTNGFTVQLSGPVGASYVIWASTNLRDWTPISTNAAPTGSVTFIDTMVTNHGSRFYKATVL